MPLRAALCPQNGIPRVYAPKSAHEHEVLNNEKGIDGRTVWV